MTDTAHRTLEMLMRETDWLRALAARLVDDPDQAEEIVQRTRVVALRTPPSGSGSFRGWLRRVATNLARQDHRERSRRDRRERVAARGEAEPSSEELVARVETQRAVGRAVVALAEPLRTTLLLRYYEGLPPREIARRMEVTVPAVESRLRRGLQRLRLALDETHGGDRERWLSSVMLLARPSAVTGVVGGTKLAVAAVVLLLGGLAVVRLATQGAGDAVASGPRPPETVEVRAAPAPLTEPEERVRDLAVAAAPPPGSELSLVVSTGLRGRVIGPDGRPASDAAVRVSPSTPGRAPGVATRTDEEGTYEVIDLRPGSSVRVRVATDAGLFGERLGVEVIADVVSAAPDIALVQGVIVRGEVRTGGGDPVVGAAVTIGHETIEPSLRTGPDGRFEVGARLPGSYPVRVVVPGFVQRDVLEVELEAGGVVDLTLIVDPAVAIEGRVVDDAGHAVAGAEVWAKIGSRSGVRGTTKRDGTFRLDAPAGGVATVGAVKAGYYVPRGMEGVPIGGPPVELKLRRHGRFRGTAVDALDGTPVALAAAEVHWKITMFGPNRPWEWIAGVGADQLGADGSFRIPIEYGSNGLFRVEARAPGYAPTFSASFAHQAGETATGIIVRMQRGFPLEVRVHDAETGAPVRGAIVDAHAVDPGGHGVRRGLENTDEHRRAAAKPAICGRTEGLGHVLARRSTDRAGGAYFDALPGGPISLVVRQRRFAPRRVDGVRPVAEASPAALSVALTPGGTIEGRVLDAHGRGRPALVVIARGPDGARGEAVSLEGGAYRIEHVVPGRYEVMVEEVKPYRDELAEEFGLPLLVDDERVDAERTWLVVEENGTAAHDVVLDAP